MTLRTRAVAGSTETKLEMRRVSVGNDAIEAVWVVRFPSGNVRTVSVPITPALLATILGRATFQGFIDNVRDDTVARVPTTEA